MYNKLLTGWKWPFGEHPYSFGWYHFLWIGIMIIACILLCHFAAKKHNEKTDRIVIFSIGATLLAAEIYKQIFFTVDCGYYQWYYFPFQFCSVPMFVAFIAPLLKKRNLQDAMYKFLASYGLLAGIAVMVYPETCLYTPYITILIHTMLWHSSMVVMGVYLIVAKGYGKNYWKDILPGFAIFFIIVAIAITANVLAEIFYFSKPELNIHGDSVNFLYISPYYNCTLPVLSTIQNKAPYVIFIICYLLAFLVGVSAIWGVCYLIRKVKEINVHKKENRSHSY